MKKIPGYLLITVIILVNACTSLKNAGVRTDDGKIDITLVQINDVYEIAPLDGGKAGGIARISTVKKNYLRTNPNTFLVIAGDFLSPSVYNSLSYNNSKIRGKQMVDVMNTAGVNLAVFGNHEFDIPEADLQKRINESNFTWVSSNTFHKKGNDIIPFAKENATGTAAFPETYIMTVKDDDGTSVRIGYIGLTLPFNKATYVSYTDVFSSAQSAYNKIKDSCDAVIAITHQSLDDDIKLARQIDRKSVV